MTFDLHGLCIPCDPTPPPPSPHCWASALWPTHTRSPAGRSSRCDQKHPLGYIYWTIFPFLELCFLTEPDLPCTWIHRRSSSSALWPSNSRNANHRTERWVLGSVSQRCSRCSQGGLQGALTGPHNRKTDGRAGEEELVLLGASSRRG